MKLSLKYFGHWDRVLEYTAVQNLIKFWWQFIHGKIISTQGIMSRGVILFLLEYIKHICIVILSVFILCIIFCQSFKLNNELMVNISTYWISINHIYLKISLNANEKNLHNKHFEKVNYSFATRTNSLKWVSKKIQKCVKLTPCVLSAIFQGIQ